MSTPLYNELHRVLAERARRDTADEMDALLDGAFIQAERIVSTNVTQYFYAGTDQEYWNFDKHFPNLAPVFDSFWIETKAPTHIRSRVFGEQPWSFSDTEYYSRPARWGAWFLNANVSNLPEAADLFKTVGLEDLKHYWVYCVMLFVEGADDVRAPRPIWSFIFIVHKETGQLLRNPASIAPDPFVWLGDPLGAFREAIAVMEAQGVPSLKVPTDKGWIAELTPRLVFEHEAISLLKPLFLAISFMHCRNVERVVNYPSPKLNRKRLARNLPPMHRFYTLEIEPMRKIIQQATASYRGLKGASGIEMALHSVIGHFKTYGPDKPLMGHAVGTWFWGGIQRGSKKRGAIKKEYKVKV